MPRVLRMSGVRRFGPVALVFLFAPLAALAQTAHVMPPLLTHSVDPKAFGTAETITVISAWSFTGAYFGNGSEGDHADDARLSGSLGRFNQNFALNTHYVATVDLPAGAVIDFIGLNSDTDTDAIIGLNFWKRNNLGVSTNLAGFSAPAHGWGTDFAGPLGILVDTHENQEFLLEVLQSAAAGDEFWAWVEIQWHRTVSPAPASPTFTDVPTSDPGFQYIEALVASGVTAGCGGGNFCPNATLTRRQMAVFLAKALGLNWPN